MVVYTVGKLLKFKNIIYKITIIMKTITLLFLTLLLTCLSQINAQQWSGSTTTSGAIERTGNVRLSGANLSLFGNQIIGFNTDDNYTNQDNFTIGNYGLTRSANSINLSGWNGLNFITRTNVRMSILNNGNVGIGTTNPEHGLLHINGNGSSKGINLWTNSGETTSRIWIDNQKKTFHMSKGDNPINGITISNGGFVGIGNTSPTDKLHVSGNIRCDSRVVITGVGALDDNGGDNMKLWSVGDLTLTSGGDSSENLVIKNNGNVGIGTTTPSEKLTVKGKILCEEVEVVVNANAPDYVFETYYKGNSELKPSYTMPTLEEVEAYTKANNHLPEVPSAEGFKKDGLELKGMSMLLLQKIEELTLYTIEQEKRIKLLEARLNN